MLSSIFGKTQQASNYSVLVVDNDKSSRQVTVDILRHEGFIIHTALSDDEIITLLDRMDTPHVLLMDINQEQAELRAFVERLRLRYGKDALATILFLTGEAWDCDATAKATGVQNYLTKPFTEEYLLKRVWSVIHTSDA